MPTQPQNRRLIVNRAGVCSNCLNGAHSICYDEYCECRLMSHGDNARQLPLFEAVAARAVRTRVVRVVHFSDSLDAVLDAIRKVAAEKDVDTILDVHVAQDSDEEGPYFQSVTHYVEAFE